MEVLCYSLFNYISPPPYPTPFGFVVITFSLPSFSKAHRV